MKQNPLKVGDRVAIYHNGVNRGVISKVESDYVCFDFFRVHWKQCRRLVKKPRKTIWVNEYEDGCFIACSSEEKAIKVPFWGSKAIRVAVPYREVKKK